MWQVPSMPEPKPATGITPVASTWSTAPVRLDNQTTRTYKVRCTRECDYVEYSTQHQEAFVEVEAESEDEARDMVEEMLRDHEVEDWDQYGDTDYGDYEHTETSNECIDHVEEVR